MESVISNKVLAAIKFIGLTICVMACLASMSGASIAATITVSCPAGQSSLLSTNLVYRNLPPTRVAYTVKNVKIYNQDGGLIYNDIPSSLVRRLSSGLTTGFNTREVVNTVDVGRLTVVTTFAGAELNDLLLVLSVGIINEPGGKETDKDTIICDRFVVTQ